jgi:hypothetical protein
MVGEEEVVVPWEEISESLNRELGAILLVAYSLPSSFGIQFQHPQ